MSYQFPVASLPKDPASRHTSTQTPILPNPDRYTIDCSTGSEFRDKRHLVRQLSAVRSPAPSVIRDPQYRVELYSLQVWERGLRKECVYKCLRLSRGSGEEL